MQSDSAEIALPLTDGSSEARSDDAASASAATPGESIDPTNIPDAQFPWAVQMPVLSQRGRLRIMRADELRSLPPPRWLIDGVLLVDTLALLWGRGATCKTFLALDFALSVANGVPWQGRATERGNALYMVGESLTGFRGRIDAWLHVHPGSDDGLYVFPSMPQFLSDQQTHEAISLAQGVGNFRLIIIDTLARAMVGGDEDKARDMSVFIEHVERLRRETGATILVVHHTTKKADGSRGSTALPWATHTEMSVIRRNESITLRCPRQKEGREFADIDLHTQSVGLGGGRESLVLVAGRGAGAPSGTPGGLTPNEHFTLAVLLQQFPNGARAKEWQTATQQAGGPKSATFYNVRGSLLGYWVTQQGRLYTPTAAALQLQQNSNGANGATP